MNKQLKKLTAVVSAAAAVTVGGIIGLSTLSEGDGVQTVLDISQGSIIISDGSILGYDSSGNEVTATDPDGYIITGSTTSNTVTVSGTQNITLQNATIDLTDCNNFCAFDIGNGGDVTLTLEGVNTIKSGKNCAGIDVIEGETLEITGTGSLTVTGGQYGAGIGTGETNGGAFSCGSVIISGGSVRAIGGDYGANVGDGAWYFSVEDYYDYLPGDPCPPKDKNGKYLYPCTIPNNSSETVYIDGVEFTPNIHSNSELAVHAYLTEDTHYINVGDKLYSTALNSDYLEVNEVTVGSAFSITATKDGEALVYGKDYTYPADPGVLTILSNKAVTISNADIAPTTDTIVVASGVLANITLDGVNIDVRAKGDACAFKIADDSTGNVTITLADDSENTLISGSGFAGLQKNSSEYNVGTLTIQGGANGTGTLTATGGSNGAGIGSAGGYSYGSNITITGGTVTAKGGTNGAGIGGGGEYSSGSNITITGGTVTANGSDNGAGIGGGYIGHGSVITISGGSVNANSDKGAGIGGGYGGKGENITISDGSVNAVSSFGAGIGGGSGSNGGGSCSNITISGGSVTAQSTITGAGIGGGQGADADNITISGGSVTASSGIGAGIGGGEGASALNITISGGSVKASGGNYTGIGGGDGKNPVTPTNGNGESVYLLTIPGTNVTVDNVAYPPIDGTVYAYLTEGEHTINVDGVTTTKRYIVYQNEYSQNVFTAVGTDLTITADSGSLVYGTDYTYPAETGVLTILSNKAVTISGTTTTDTIFVNSDVSANITLDGVNIDVSGTGSAGNDEPGKAAFEISSGSTGNVNINLADGSVNTLTSGSNCAGLQKNGGYISADKGKLTITGNTGTLTATGGDNGAGIGGGYNASGSNIIISGGSVTAQSFTGAGIGGGYEGSAENIIISGGTVTATGGNMGAGIGGGNNHSGSNIIISGGTVIANGGNGGAGIGGGTGGSGSDITISGGSVTAKSNGGGAGIGGGESGKGSNITISGGTVTATGGWDAAGIGSGNGAYEYNVSGSNITISGGTVTANGGDRGAGIGGGNKASGSNITISGGSVKAVAGSEANAIGGGKDGNGAVTPTNGTNEVYLLEIANDSGEAITIDGKTYPTSHDVEKKIYAYLTGETHIIKVGENTYLRKFNSASKEFAAPDLTLTGDNLVYGTDYTLVNDTFTIKTEKPITISGSTTSENVFVAKNILANITLDGVSIDVSATSRKTAFEIETDSTGNVTVTLVGDNTLKSGEYCAGLQKNGNNGTLKITGTTGKLTAVGGAGGAGIGGGSRGSGSDITINGGTVTATGGHGGAGIGGGNFGSGSYITINGGTVTATGGHDGAGIGGGFDGSGSNITINGGTVTANGGERAAGIGGGYCEPRHDSSGSYITISGGTVTATGGYSGAGIGGGSGGSGSYITISGGTVTANGDHSGAGIGGGSGSCSGSNITISGGTVTATGGDYGAGIGGGESCSNIIISGGSVKAVAGSEDSYAIGGFEAVTPTNDNIENVYLLTIANPGGESVYIDGELYPLTEHSAEDKNIYAYLTGKPHTITVGEVTTEYKFYDGVFLPVPKASDFDFAEPDNLDYTGTAKQAAVAWKNGITGGGTITAVKYYNAAGEEVTQGADFVPGTYTVKIDVAKGDNYAEATAITSNDWTFTITAGDLTVSGTGKASGTFGDKLSELTVSGLTAKLGEIEIAGTWALSGSDVPNVGDTKKYTATFTPSENADWYNELTAEVSLDIAKANAPEIADIELSYNWATTGEKTANVSGLPDNMGTLGKLTAEISDENGVLTAGSASYSGGKVYFTLNSNTEESVGNKATIKVTLPSQNYKDITFSVIVSITAKLDKDAPAESKFELNVDLLSDNTYKVTITTALTGVEYSFDGTTWSSTNTKAVGHAETVTGYIRFAETDKYNVSPYSSKTAATGHGTLTHHAAKAATCTEDGNIEYWTCDSCKLYFSNANGTTEITQAQTVLTKLGHKWAEKYNFDKDGHWHKCEVCGDTSEKEAHISGGEATADSADICTVCGYEITPKIGQVAAPLFAPNGGTFTEIQTVTISSATEGAEIYYTTDGTEPTTSSTKYTAAITIGKTTTFKAVAVKDGMVDSEVVSATFTKKSSGGGGGGGGYRPTTPTEPNNPSIGGSSKSWSDVAADLGKLTTGSETTIELNGNTTVPVDVIKAIADKDSKVTLAIDSVYKWVVDGSKITTPAEADLTLTKTTGTNHDGLRGVEGTQFRMNDTGIPTSLEIAFKTSHAGKFANLYKVVDGKQVFVTCAKLGEDGKVILPDVTEKGDYVAMLCEFSDRLGDMDNDGIMNAKDARAILKDIVGLETGKNPLMADFNGDGRINAMDAAAILKRIVGLA